MKLTHYTVHHRLATGAIVLALLVLGIYGLVQLPVDLLPKITYPLVRVNVWWRGATPEDIVKNIADPIERQMATVDGIDYLQSSSIEGMYSLEVNFRYGVNVDVAYQDALAAMSRIAKSLPKDIDPPVIYKADPSQLPVLQLTVASGEWDPTRLRTWVDGWLQYRMIAVPGVAGAEIVGGLKREIRVHLDPAELEKRGLTLAGILKRLQQENIEQFGGRVTQGTREFIARTRNEYRSLDDIRNVPIARDGIAKILLRDIAQVEDAHEEVRVITRFNGKPAVKLSVLKQPDANTVEVAKAVAQRVEELKPVIPRHIRFGIVENQAYYVGAALAGVRNAALEAAILVVVILALFLGSWRQVVAMAWALPVTLLINFGLMKLAGFSLNIFSLGGLVVAIAVDLDNSIIVIENITRLRRERPEMPVGELVVAATRQVGPAVVAATLSFLALFLPFLLVPGLASLLFRELVLVIAGVMVISLVMAISVTPIVMAIVLGKRSPQAERLSFFERIIERITEAYGRLLEKTIRLRWITIASFASLLVVGAILLPRLGSEFLPQMDDGRIMVKVRLPTGTSVAQTEQVLSRLEKAIGEDPLIDNTFTLVSGKVTGVVTYEIANEGQIDIQLVSRSERKLSTDQYMAGLQKRLADVKLPAGKAMVMKSGIRGTRKVGSADIEVKVKGENIARLYDLAGQIAQAMQSLKQFKNVYVSMDMSKPEYQVRADRVRAAELGVSAADIAATLRTFVSGEVATRYRDGDEYFNIRLMVPESRIASRQAIENLALPCAQGGYLRIRDVADVAEAVGPVEIIREDQIQQVIIRGEAVGVSVGSALQALDAALAKIELPTGYELRFGGQAQLMDEMRRSLLTVLAFALFFAFVILVVQFNSFKLPLYILAGVPISLSGLVIVLYLTGIPLGATVIIGVLVVVAANVMEGVLVMNYAEEIRRDEQKSPLEAIVKAARIRFRPRMMTSLGVLVGFIPLALNLEAGGEMLQPMAAGAIGGILVTVFVTLFFVPCLYVTASGRKSQQRMSA
jgi:hydrophobic/amphiphilic exporter-1 (mainly G- bacteria), HAE1 family